MLNAKTAETRQWRLRSRCWRSGVVAMAIAAFFYCSIMLSQDPIPKTKNDVRAPTRMLGHVLDDRDRKRRYDDEAVVLLET